MSKESHDSGQTVVIGSLPGKLRCMHIVAGAAELFYVLPADLAQWNAWKNT